MPHVGNQKPCAREFAIIGSKGKKEKKEKNLPNADGIY
jgi:hypothetical protein